MGECVPLPIALSCANRGGFIAEAASVIDYDTHGPGRYQERHLCNGSVFAVRGKCDGKKTVHQLEWGLCESSGSDLAENIRRTVFLMYCTTTTLLNIVLRVLEITMKHVVKLTSPGARCASTFIP